MGNYDIKKSKKFLETDIPKNVVEQCFEFAYGMSSGNNHRENRSGGSARRKPNEIFANAFQGKLAEFIVYQNLKDAGFELNPPDVGIYGRGVWDDVDIEVNEKKISVKSTTHFGNLLLLETKDYDSNGTYIPNDTIYDYTILVRIKPNLKGILKKDKKLYSKSSEEELHSIVFTQSWEYDFGGYITATILKDMITSKQIIFRGDTVNNKTLIDADNYLIECADMENIETLHDLLK